MPEASAAPSTRVPETGVLMPAAPASPRLES